MTSANKLLLSHFLPYRISALSNRISNELANQYSQKFNVSVPEWRVIAILGERQKCTAAKIVTLTVMDKVAVSRAVKKLLDKNVVSRVSNEQDLRSQDLQLTEHGTHLYEQIIPLAKSYEEALLNKLSIQEQNKLWQLLKKLEA
jgi:DNA-binding MarR family transcriptional regulator